MMAKLKEALRSARKIEWILLLVAAALAMLLLLPDTDDVPVMATSLEDRIARVISEIDGAGDVRVMVTENEHGAVGVLVVCDGANDIGVMLDVQRAVKTLLNVELSQIEILCKRKD